MHAPLRATEAKKLAREILVNGAVFFTRHCREELAKDGMAIADAENVIRDGSFREAEFENGAWRYQVHTSRFVVVVEFDAVTRLIVVTAWRKQ